jgi:DNA-binding MarR family transcriptional regulator
MQAYRLEDFHPDSSFGYLARCVHQTGGAALEPLFAEEGLTYSQWSVMALLIHGKGSTCAELARLLAHDNGAMTRLVDTLEAQGWLKRSRDADDRRVINLAVTPEGFAVAQRCKLRVMAAWNLWLRDWDRSEFETLQRLLQKLKDTLDTATTAVPA